jgi:hypothetical protein
VALVRLGLIISGPRTWAAPGRDALESDAERIRRWVVGRAPATDTDLYAWPTLRQHAAATRNDVTTRRPGRVAACSRPRTQRPRCVSLMNASRCAKRLSRPWTPDASLAESDAQVRCRPSRSRHPSADQYADPAAHGVRRAVVQPLPWPSPRTRPGTARRECGRAYPSARPSIHRRLQR